MRGHCVLEEDNSIAGLQVGLGCEVELYRICARLEVYDDFA